MVQHALDRGYEVIGVCRERSVEKLDGFKGLEGEQLALRAMASPPPEAGRAVMVERRDSARAGVES
jgi:hypothetical protein